MTKTTCRLWDNFNAVSRAIAETKGLDVSKLSRRSGVSRQAIHNYWAGKSIPGLERIEMIANALDVEPQVLLAAPGTVDIDAVVTGKVRYPSMKPVPPEKMLSRDDRKALALGRRLMKIKHYDRLLRACENAPACKIHAIITLLE